MFGKATAVETSVYNITAPSAVYEIGGRRFETEARGFADAVAAAHAAHQRPRCLCQVEGVEMYVARLGEGYIVKRMPDTGSHHVPDCPSYEPPAEFSGLAQVLGSAITEDPVTGETTLRLDFPLTNMPSRSTMPPTGIEGDSVPSIGAKLSLRGLLHYLWDQAELTRWHPGFTGKRNWGTVRRHLLKATDGKIAKGFTLSARLYIPEVFSVDRRDAIHARRSTQWTLAAAESGKTRPLMMVLAEVKRLAPSRFGCSIVFKHIPDLTFSIDESLYRRLRRRFERELSLWGTAGNVQMLLLGTISTSGGVPSLAEFCLMTVTGEWLPVADANERQLIGRLVRDRRCFFKALRYDLPLWRPVPSAILTDVGATPVPLWINTERDDTQNGVAEEYGTEADPLIWTWRARKTTMPALPPKNRVPSRDDRSASSRKRTSLWETYPTRSRSWLL